MTLGNPHKPHCTCRSKPKKEKKRHLSTAKYVVPQSTFLSQTWIVSGPFFRLPSKLAPSGCQVRATCVWIWSLNFFRQRCSLSLIIRWWYSQGRLSNRSLISGGQMQIITQCLLSLPRYSALWVHTLFPSHSALWGRRECELSCNLHLAPKNNTALNYYYLDALGCSLKSNSAYIQYIRFTYLKSDHFSIGTISCEISLSAVSHFLVVVGWHSS